MIRTPSDSSIARMPPPPAPDGGASLPGRRAWAVGAGLVLLAALALRLYAADAQSLWYDEGFAVQTARLPLPALVERLVREDNHSPLHYLILHFWMPLAGDSETALRFSSVIVGVLMVALTYAIFREIFHGRPQADLAALVAGAPAAALNLAHHGLGGLGVGDIVNHHVGTGARQTQRHGAAYA